MIDFENGRPEQVLLKAIPDGLQSLTTFNATKEHNLGEFVVDPYQNTVTYSLPESIVSKDIDVNIFGYVPRGWVTKDPLLKIPSKQTTGVWHYPEEQEKNILAGLAYLTIQPKDGSTPPLRVQIEPEIRPKAVFEDFVTVTALAGSCQTKVTVDGILEDEPLVMEPAQVIIARTAAQNTENGNREQEIGCAVRVGGAFIDGIGKIEIGMFGTNNPGHIVSMKEDSDFPAKMTLDVRKHYITPIGTFYSNREEFFAENIERFPPFGVKFTPVQETVPLLEEKSGNVVGELKLGWLVPLCYLDASTFPPRALPTFLETDQ